MPRAWNPPPETPLLWIAVNPYYAGHEVGRYATEALGWAAVKALTDKQRHKYEHVGGRLDVMTVLQYSEIVGRLQAMDDDDDAEDIIYHVLGRN